MRTRRDSLRLLLLLGGGGGGAIDRRTDRSSRKIRWREKFLLFRYFRGLFRWIIFGEARSAGRRGRGTWEGIRDE